jgi:cell division protein FtsI/penicillin-binding protein 2
VRLKKTKKKKKSFVLVRMNILFFVVFLLFSGLILRLGIVQIVYGEDYKREIQRTEDVTVNTSVPRGKIYDRNGHVIVDNIPINAITYTRSKTANTKDMVDVAKKLSKLIKMDTKSITERDKKDFWIYKHDKEAKAKITKAEWKKFEAGKIADSDIYNLQLERIKDTDLATFTPDQLQVLAIFREFNSGFALTPHIVKNVGVTAEEFAKVSEHLNELPGVNTTSDWERYYSYDKTLRTILGNVSTSREGLPKELVNYYLAREYSRNDRVGKSYIELQYEDVLRGQKAKVKNVTDKSGNVINSEVVREGQRGKDLVLSIDMDLQKAAEDIILDVMKEIKSQPGHEMYDRSFIVVTDPYTGEILTMAGKQYVTDPDTGKTQIQDYALGTLTSSYEVGSAVKGATLLTGYMTKAITPGETIVDEPIRIKGTPKKASWFNADGRMPITDSFALEISSNSYMFKVALKIAGARYVPNQPIDIDTGAFNTMRQHFNQFGLGVNTGLDLPGEVKGITGPGKLPGNLMDLAIGQFDTYTPMQLAQYVSTIANGGNRMQMHVVKEIRDPVSTTGELGPIVKEIQPKVLNRLDVQPGWIDHIKDGFHRVFHNSHGTSRDYFSTQVQYDAAGKTGTAETHYYGPKESYHGNFVYNETLAGYAPYNHPEIAFATIAPWAFSTQDHNVSPNEMIAQRVLTKYFELKKERADKGLAQAQTTHKVDNINEVQKDQAKQREAIQSGNDSSLSGH